MRGSNQTELFRQFLEETVRELVTRGLSVREAVELLADIRLFDWHGVDVVRVAHGLPTRYE